MTPDHEKFVRSLRDIVFNWFKLKFPQDRQLVEDLTQDTFLRLAKFEALDASKVGLVRKAMNWTYLDYLRGLYRAQHETFDESIHGIETEINMSPDTVSDDLLEGINRLPKKSRQIAVLRFVKGLKIEEIANLLDMGESAVKMQIKRAKSKLRSILKKQDII